MCTAVMNTGDQDAHDLAHWQGGAHRPDSQARRVHRHDQVCVLVCVLVCLEDEHSFYVLVSSSTFPCFDVPVRIDQSEVVDHLEMVALDSAGGCPCFASVAHREASCELFVEQSSWNICEMSRSLAHFSVFKLQLMTPLD